MPLDPEAVQALLAGTNKRAPRESKTPQGLEPRSKPLQIGHLKYTDKPELCMGGKAGRCGSPTCIRIDGVPKCSSHALYELNYLINKRDYAEGRTKINPDDCTCNSGKHSKFQIHVEGCVLYSQIQEERANPIVDTNVETMELL